MDPRQKRLMIEQLDKTLKNFKLLNSTMRPPKGWLRAVRTALGMNGRQLAERLNLSQERVWRIEQDEVGGAVTLQTMNNVAEAMDCSFVYVLVPNKSLIESVKAQAVKVAKERIQKTSHSMMLEDQQLSEKELKKMLKEMVDDLVKTMPRNLWDKQ